MDDLWGNAWSQPEEDVAGGAPSNFKALDSASAPWSLPAASKDEEADVGLPSWSAGALNWTEPTGQASLWSSDVAADDLRLGTHTGADGWAAGPASLSLGFGEVEMDEEERKSEEDEEVHTAAGGSSVEEAIAVDRGNDVLSPIEDPHVESSTLQFAIPINSPSFKDHGITTEPKEEFKPSPVAPDALENTNPFGAFEASHGPSPNAEDSFDDDDDDAWGTPVATFDDDVDDSWGSAWGASTSKEKEVEPPKDEWAVAREEKQRRDSKVPPELIASIMDRLNELPPDLWPERPKADDQPEFGNWRNGMGNVEGLEELVAKVLPVPSTHFQPPVHFPRSHTAKAMANSVKLSKNLPLVRLSPMTHLFAAKSASAWELSVKSRVDAPKDDVPAGWRMAEPQEKEAKPAFVEKKSGGLLSFWSRRSSTMPSSTPSTSTATPAPTTPAVQMQAQTKRTSQSQERSASPAPSKASVPGSGPSSARASVDVQISPDKMQSSLSLSSVSSATVNPAAAIASSSSLPSMPTSTSDTLSTQTDAKPESPSVPPTPAPSAVSRFLNRFSRAKSDARTSATSPRSSMALSTDDLDFLSDVVPSHIDDADGDEDDQLSALTAMVSTPALPGKLPPPLAPPPLLPPPRPSSVVRAQTPQSRSSTPKPPSVFDDLDALMSGPVLAASPMRSASPGGSGSAFALPPPLPPPISPTSLASLSKPPTPSPLSGHSRNSSRSSTAPVSSPLNNILSPVASPPPPPIPRSPPVGLGFATQPQPQLNVIAGSPASVPTGLPPLLPPAPSSASIAAATKTPSPTRQQSMLSSPLPPPPIEKSPNRVFPRPNSASRVDFDAFAEFRSLPPSSPQSGSSWVTTTQTSLGFDMLSDQSMLSQHNGPEDDSFGDFGDFISTTPAPVPSSAVVPIASPPSPPAIPPPLPMKQPPVLASLTSQSQVRRSLESSHQAAAKLVEKAAALKDQWPSPASPVPQRLSSPPRSASSMGSAFPAPSIALKPIAQIMSSTAARSPSPPVVSSNLPGPNLGASFPSLLDDFAPPPPPQPSNSAPFLSPPMFSQTSSPPTQSTSKPSHHGPAVTKGGLSAQDLSFFEGL